jgi:Ca2+-binding EF-hand superfamily protein
MLFLLLLMAHPASAQGLGGRDPLAVFDGADADHDGVVTRAEFLAARAARFDKMDRNHDGVVSRDDLPRRLRRRAKAAGRFDALIAELDRNGDGQVTRAELAAAPPRLFDAADADHDGRVDKAELDALRRRAAARKDGGR